MAVGALLFQSRLAATLAALSSAARVGGTDICSICPILSLLRPQGICTNQASSKGLSPSSGSCQPWLIDSAGAV